MSLAAAFTLFSDANRKGSSYYWSERARVHFVSNEREREERTALPAPLLLRLLLPLISSSSFIIADVCNFFVSLAFRVSESDDEKTHTTRREPPELAPRSSFARSVFTDNAGADGRKKNHAHSSSNKTRLIVVQQTSHYIYIFFFFGLFFVDAVVVAVAFFFFLFAFFFALVKICCLYFSRHRLTERERM